MRLETPPLSTLGRTMRTMLMVISATLALGLVLSLLPGAPFELVGIRLVWIGLGMLVAVPLVNVVDVLVIEWRLKEWPFAGAALGVLVMLAWTILNKLMR